MIRVGGEMEKRITVQVAEDQETFEQQGCMFETTHETLKEAKQKARYYLSEEYMNVIEASRRLGYAQVLVNGRCEYDYFGED
jgi:hypothetical protein